MPLSPNSQPKPSHNGCDKKDIVAALGVSRPTESLSDMLRRRLGVKSQKNRVPTKIERRIQNLDALLSMVKPLPEEWLKIEEQTVDSQVLQVSGTDPWGEPLFIDPRDDLPAFPVAALPSGLGEWVNAVAENSQTPVDLTAMMALAAVAVSVAKKIEIQPYRNNPDYVEPANIWTCIPLPSGNRKTFVVKVVRTPFDTYLDRFKKDNFHRLMLQREELAALEKKKKKLNDELAQAENDKVGKRVKVELAACLEAIAAINLKVPRYFADDTTPERLVVLLSQNGGRMAVLSDEGGCFDHFAGIYNKHPNLDVYLHSHSGGTILRDRQMGGEEICVKHAALTLGISPQPQVISGMTSKDRLQGRGILARFLWSCPKSMLGNRNWMPQPIPGKLKKQYNQKILNLLEWSPKETVKVTLTAHAFGLWIGVARRFEKQLGGNGPLATPGIQEWAGKLPGAIARIALLLHCVSSGKEPQPEINADTMRRAINIGDYLIPHALAAFRVLRTDPASEAALVLQKWIIKRAEQGILVFTKSQAQQNHKSRFPNIADMDRPLQILMDRQICRPRILESKGKFKGRPSVFYEINPGLIDSDLLHKT